MSLNIKTGTVQPANKLIMKTHSSVTVCRQPRWLQVLPILSFMNIMLRGLVPGGSRCFVKGPGAETWGGSGVERLGRGLSGRVLLSSSHTIL